MLLNCSFVRTGGGYMPLEYGSALVSLNSPQDGDSQEEEQEQGKSQRLGHRHRVSVKPGLQCKLQSADYAILHESVLWVKHV